jgi:hypothetical protein
MKRLGRIFIKTIIVLAIFELFSFILLSVWQRQVSWPRTFYAAESSKVAGGRRIGGLEDNGCSWGEGVSLHPYLVYHYHRNPGGCEHRTINDLGFVGREIPLQKEPAYYTILLLGGSVAENIGWPFGGNPPDLEAYLNDNYISPNGKPFFVMNAAIAGGQMPMQLHSFLALHELADAVISVEGFNEFGTYGKDRVEALPLVWKQIAAGYGDGYRGLVWARFGSDVFMWMSRNPVFSRSYAAFLVAAVIARWSRRSTPLEDRSPLTPLPPEMNEQQRRDFHSEQYEKYLVDLHAMAAASHMKDAYFLQPVPALYKPLSENDKRIVGDISYGPAYKQMTDRLLELRKKGVPMISLLATFSSFAGDLYIDNIHFDGASPGRRMLSEAMAAQLEREWGLKKKPKRD